MEIHFLNFQSRSLTIFSLFAINCNPTNSKAQSIIILTPPKTYTFYIQTHSCLACPKPFQADCKAVFQVHYILAQLLAGNPGGALFEVTGHNTEGYRRKCCRCFEMRCLANSWQVWYTNGALMLASV